jgi:hypothetical protein
MNVFDLLMNYLQLTAGLCDPKMHSRLYLAYVNRELVNVMEHADRVLLSIPIQKLQRLDAGLQEDIKKCLLELKRWANQHSATDDEPPDDGDLVRLVLAP